jgi:hypothetical protein
VTSVRDLLPPVCPAAESVFWSGAGISADPPTCAPTGTCLAERALGHAFAAGTAATIERYYQRLRLKGRSCPRLETVLDVVNLHPRRTGSLRSTQ